MSKDTSCAPASPELFAHPAGNLPFAMGFPFPAITPPLGHFIPMSMVPINGITMQHYMDSASKSGLHPAMFAPMFGPSAMAPLNILSNQSGDKFGNEYCGNIGKKGMEEMQTEHGFPSSFVSTHDITKGTGSPNVYSMASDDNPVMPLPSVFFLPFSPGGMAGYFPHYPPFCVMPSKREELQPKDSNLLDDLSERGVISLNIPEERKDSDELDVARILVDMQVPVLKQIGHSETKLDSSNIMVTKDLNVVKNTNNNENTSSMDGILSTASLTSAPLEVLSSKTHQNKDAPLVFQHCSEQNDKHLENPNLNNVMITLFDRQSSENEEEKEVEDLDHNDQVRPEEMQLEENKLGDPIDIKLEVISEGESTKPVSIKTVDNTDSVELQELLQNEAKVIPIDRCSVEENLQELVCTPSDEVNVSSVKTPVILASKASTESLSDAIASYHCSQQINPEFEDKNVLKQESPEEIKDQSDTEKDINFGPLDDQSSDENGLPPKNFKCGVCSQLFRSPLGLQKHIEFHMDDGKHFTCTICFMNFCDEPALQEHHEKHMRKRPHKCKFCPKAFRDPGSLQKHVRVHTGEKPYKCKDCSGSFAEYSSLRKHQRVHTGEQPYKCKYCSKAFSISGNLQRHILIHTGERPYKCNFCTKAFNNPSHLRRHVKNLHFRDAAIDETMLSHYGNHTKTNDSDSSIGLNEEGTIKTKSQPFNNTLASGSN